MSHTRDNSRVRRMLKCHRAIVYQKSSAEIIILHRTTTDIIRTCPRRVKGFYKRTTWSEIDVRSRCAIRARVNRAISHYLVRNPSVYQPFFIVLDTSSLRERKGRGFVRFQARAHRVRTFATRMDLIGITRN